MASLLPSGESAIDVTQPAPDDAMGSARTVALGLEPGVMWIRYQAVGGMRTFGNWWCPAAVATTKVRSSAAAVTLTAPPPGNGPRVNKGPEKVSPTTTFAGAGLFRVHWSSAT